MLFLILKCVDYSLFLFSRRKEKCLAEKKREWRLSMADCLSQLQSNWLFLFFKPKGVSSLTKRRKGLGEKEKRLADCHKGQSA